MRFQGHAEVVEAWREPGIVLHELVKGGNGPGSPPARHCPHPVLVNLDEADVVQNGGRLRADFLSLLVIGQGRRGITPRVPFRAVQRQGQRKVRPEVVGILLPDAPEKADPVLTGRGQPFAQRQQQRYGLLRQRRRLRQLGQGLPISPGRWVAHPVAPGVGVRPARQAQQPILPGRVGGTDRPVIQRGDDVGNPFGGPDSRCDSLRIVGRLAQPLVSESLGVVPIRPGLVEAQQGAVVELPLGQG